MTNKGEFCPIAANEYLFTSYVNGRNTLSKHVNQIRPGELITFREKSGKVVPDIEEYFAYFPVSGSSPPDLERLDQIFDHVFERLVTVADGRPIILPLTGGYDSRIIALKLNDIGYENVISYTRVESDATEDLEKAKDIADDLGIKHVRINLDESTFRDHYLSGEWAKFQESVGFLSELPELKSTILYNFFEKDERFPDEGIHVPGHHPLGGASKLSTWLKGNSVLSQEEFLQYIWNYNYVRWRIYPLSGDERQIEKELRNRILDSIPQNLYCNSSTEPIERAVAGLETYFWKDKLPKYFLTHSEEIFGNFRDWYPLLDKQYFEFLKDLDHSCRLSKSIQKKYARYLSNRILSESLLASEQFESSSDAKFTGGFGSTVKNHIWDHSTQILSLSPGPVEQLIKLIYYGVYSDRGSYDSDPAFNIISQELFNQMNLRITHYQPLQLLLLYHEDWFQLEVQTLLDNALNGANVKNYD